MTSAAGTRAVPAAANEEILDPRRVIVDPHHHLWHHAGERYLLDELLADTGSGHRIDATVFVECLAFYRAAGPVEKRPIGEVEFANGIAAMAASGRYGPTQVCAAIVGHADLRLGAAAREVLEAQLAAGNGRLRGIRHTAGWDADPRVRPSHSNPPPGLYAQPSFRAGFAELGPLGLSFDAWQYHPQLPDLVALARAFPATTIVVDHCGGPLGIGPYAGRHEAVFSHWRLAIAELALCPNVVVKLGGLGMKIGPSGFHRRDRPPDSMALASAYRPWIETCIEAFGVNRCMFESNFPVDKVSGGYATLWNAFKRIAAAASEQEKRALFADTARRVYRL